MSSIEVTEASASAPDSANSKQRILVLFAHPSLERSEVNHLMAKATNLVDNVTLVDLYAEYPDLQINIEKEQERLLSHDIIVFMHPLYWYSTPAILKEWQDLVLEHGFAYGSKGIALHDKLFFNAISAGGLESYYKTEGHNQFTIRELLRPLEQTANLCGMIYLAPFVLFGARTAVEEGLVNDHVGDWIHLLKALRDGRVDIERAKGLPKLNGDLDQLIKEPLSKDEKS